MTFGSSKWEGSPWVLDEEESLKVIKKAYDLGINTWVCSMFGSSSLVDDETMGGDLDGWTMC